MTSTDGRRRWVRRLLLAPLLALAAFLLLAALGFRSDLSLATLEAEYASPPSAFLDVDGLRVHYRDRGTGPPLVLLHGSNSSLFTWEGWVAALSPTHRVITLDLPGHGLTGPDPRNRYSAAQMADLVHAFARALGLSRYAVAGNSMGGSVAWHLALAHPDAVDHLILIDSAGLPRHEPRPLPFGLAASPVWGHLFRWITPRFMVARSVAATYGDPSRITDANVDLYYRLLRRDGNREATRRRFALPPADELALRLGEIRAPTLILWGEKDTWILPTYAAQFQSKIPGARLVMLPGLAHVPMEEAPAETARLAADFLGR